MILRKVATEQLAKCASSNLKIVSCLGWTSRDMYHYSTTSSRDNYFFNVGAMGSALPFALGVAMVKTEIEMWVIEGDGSVLMNLGGLVTFKRYNPGNLTLFILDNRQYETTGGQPSQPQDFDLNNVCKAVGLRSVTVREIKQLQNTISLITNQKVKYDIVLIKTRPDSACPRITISPTKIAEDFRSGLRGVNRKKSLKC